MNVLFEHMQWAALLVGWFLAFALGAVWYSPAMFLVKWKEGLGVQAVPGRPLSRLLLLQAISTFFYAWLLALSYQHSLWLAVLAAVTASAMTKANGMYSGKTVYAVATESGFALVQAIIILVILYLIK